VCISLLLQSPHISASVTHLLQQHSERHRAAAAVQSLLISLQCDIDLHVAHVMLNQSEMNIMTAVAHVQYSAALHVWETELLDSVR